MIANLSQLEFAQVWVLLLLAIPILMAWWQFRRPSPQPTIVLPQGAVIKATESWRSQLVRLLPYLPILALIAVILALARPRTSNEIRQINAEGISIMLAIDLSTSMLARDFEPNRLEASKRVAQDFVDNRPYDLVGLTVFAGEAYTQCPLTNDHQVLKKFISQIAIGQMEDGTAIGEGLAVASNRLKESESNTKVVILLTDGVNTAGYVQPRIASAIAKELNIRVYTIGVGTMGTALAPVSYNLRGQLTYSKQKVEIDEELLQEIAETTGGKYYRATNEESLIQIYDEIDQLEKTKIEVNIYKQYKEWFPYFALLAAGLLLLAFLLRYLLLRPLP